jgi:hypothetical protein
VGPSESGRGRDAATHGYSGLHAPTGLRPTPQTDSSPPCCAASTCSKDFPPSEAAPSLTERLAASSSTFPQPGIKQIEQSSKAVWDGFAAGFTLNTRGREAAYNFFRRKSSRLRVEPMADALAGEVARAPGPPPGPFARPLFRRTRTARGIPTAAAARGTRTIRPIWAALAKARGD